MEVTADWASGEVSVKQLGSNSSAIDGIELEKGIIYSDNFKKTYALKIMEVNVHFLNSLYFYFKRIANIFII